MTELLVIGGGTAGLVAAKTAAGLGARVTLVERARTGGECLWTGCVPSKALLAAAHAAAAARAAGRFGVHADVTVDFAAVRAHVRTAIARIEPVDSPAALRAAGVEVVPGTARFVARDAVEIDGRRLRFRHAIVATGSAPVVGHALGDAYTNETVWDLATLPARLLVVGAGSVGCELGQAFARLGSTVTLVEREPTVLPGTDVDATARLTAALIADGVDVRAGCTVRAVRDGRAELSDGSTVAIDAVLAATGRSARTADLGLEAAGVACDAHGQVRVDEQLRTTSDRVWAAGDVTARPRFTHVAGVDASVAATNAVLGLRRVADPLVPRVTFTEPEIASVGAWAGRRARTVEHDDVDRAVTDGATDGFSRLVLDRRGRVIGATVVGPRAGEVLAEVVLAIRTRRRARDLAGALHAYPTYADGVWKAAIADVQATLRHRPIRMVLTVMRWVRRRRLVTRTGRF